MIPARNLCQIELKTKGYEKTFVVLRTVSTLRFSDLLSFAFVHLILTDSKLNTMKKKLYGIVACCMLALSCQKPLEKILPSDDQLNNEAGLTAFAVTCPPTVLSGTISTNTTLSASTAYLLRGNVVVDGATLTIPAGTVIMGEKATNGALIIKPNAQISAIGTATNPIIFTSDQAAGARAAGDWFGVAILGNAPNNRSNNLSLSINGATFNAGSTNATSSAGRFEYVQIHYAGKGGGGGDVLTESSLILGSIGSGMTAHHIQISNSKNDGLGIWGGAIGVKQIFTYKSTRMEIRTSQGYRGNMQHLLAFKDDAVAPGSNIPTFEITNQLVGTTSVLQTYPTVSNASLLGGEFCSASDPKYNEGFRIKNEGDARIYNSVLEGYLQYGLNLESSNVVAKTAAGTDQLQFSYNTIANLASPYGASFTAPHTTWVAAGGCNAISTNTMADWLLAGAPPSCRESGNQIGTLSTGYYNSSLCGNKCSTFPNLYINTTNDLEDPDYSMLTGFFDQPVYRGALQSSTDTWLKNTWVDFCMLTRNYCE